MGRTEILKQLKQSFVEEDVKEPFQNREYVEETLGIFDMLIDGFDLGLDETDSAVQDIVGDIFRYFDETDELTRLIQKKREIIKYEKENKQD